MKWLLLGSLSAQHAYIVHVHTYIAIITPYPSVSEKTDL